MIQVNENNKVFTHIYGGIELRTLVDEQGTPWFLAKDVCAGLGLRGSVNRVCAKLCDFERSNAHPMSIGLKRGGKPPLIISESGFYKLVMRSDKQEAVQFQRWVCEEVLPEIRKTGSYEAGSDAPAILKDVANSINPLDATFVAAREYCQLKGLPEELKGPLGKIATRICLDQNKPKRWTNINKKDIKKYKLKFHSIGQYPVTVLDEALSLYKEESEKYANE